MKPRRIFIAIPLTKEVKEQLLHYKDDWTDVPARWTKPENLHITLAFLGNKSEKELEHVITITETLAKDQPQLDILFRDIVYGPTPTYADKPTPFHKARMIWARLEEAPVLVRFQTELAQALYKNNLYTPDVHEYSPHVTLARLSMMRFQQIDPEERRRIYEPLNIKTTIDTVDVMESSLKRSGAEYSLIESISLLGKD